MLLYTRNHYSQLFTYQRHSAIYFNHHNSFVGCAEGLSLEADISLDIAPETCFQDGGDFSSQLPEMGELQFPNRLPRQLLQSRVPRTNQLGGVVLKAPGAPAALPLQTLTPAQQALHSSLTAINNVISQSLV